MGITIKELSKISGYSCATISRVITKQNNVKEETRRAIEELLIQYDYRTNIMELRASELRQKMILIIVGDLDSWYYMEMIRAIKRETAKGRYVVVIGYSDNSVQQEEEYVKIAIQEKYAGIIFVNVRGGDNISRLLKQSGMPVVFLNRGIRLSDFDTIRSDNYYGSYMITSYLIEMGHRKIGHLAGNQYSSTAMERRRGYEDAMCAGKLPVTGKSIHVGELNWESGYQYGERIVKEGLDYTAVFCGNDLMAGGLLEAFAHYGVKVPEDISVVCYDDTPVTARAGLTTVGADPVRMGKKAVELLVTTIEGKHEEGSSIVYRPQIMTRNSVKKLV